VLSLQECRSLLGADCTLTDSQLEQLRRQLYAWSEVAIGELCAQKKPTSQKNSPANGGNCLSIIPDTEREAVEERAAILEFEAGLGRPEAERQAFGEWAKLKKPGEKQQRSAGKKNSRKRRIRLD
jgi:hypothetical protein